MKLDEKDLNMQDADKPQITYLQGGRAHKEAACGAQVKDRAPLVCLWMVHWSPDNRITQVALWKDLIKPSRAQCQRK